MNDSFANNSDPFESYQILPCDPLMRLDKDLTQRFSSYSRTYFQYLIENGSVLVNGKPAKKSHKLSIGDEVELFFLASPEITLEPENIPLEILYEDEWIIAINKPAGMVVHPAPGHNQGTLVNALLYHCKQLPKTDQLRPGIVHRLDKETSGLIIAAKTGMAHSKLVSLFAERKIEKEYLAIAKGKLLKEITHETLIGRDPSHRQKMANLPENGKQAITLLIPLSHAERYTLLLAKPKTGRTHQIRLHLKDLKTPILGDKLYSHLSPQDPLRHMLHAHALHFIHPFTNHPISLQAPLPADFKEQLHKCNLTFN